MATKEDKTAKVEDLKAEETNAEETKEEKTKVDYWDELVDFDVPLSESEKGPLMIMVNGHYWKMQRGKTVKVPRYVVQTFRDSQDQKLASLKKQEECKNQNLTGE